LRAEADWAAPARAAALSSLSTRARSRWHSACACLASSVRAACASWARLSSVSSSDS
jgi:hypothetical protein